MKTTRVLSLSRFIHKGGVENRRGTAAKNSRELVKWRGGRNATTVQGKKGRGPALTTSRVRRCTRAAFVLKACKFVAPGELSGNAKESDDEINAEGARAG